MMKSGGPGDALDCRGARIGIDLAAGERERLGAVGDRLVPPDCLTDGVGESPDRLPLEAGEGAVGVEVELAGFMNRRRVGLVIP